jgi:hypothetical protein
MANGEPGRAMDEATLRGAIDRLTRALLTVADHVIPELVSERAALRAELRELRQAAAGVELLDEERARRVPPR